MVKFDFVFNGSDIVKMMELAESGSVYAKVQLDNLGLNKTKKNSNAGVIEPHNQNRAVEINIKEEKIKSDLRLKLKSDHHSFTWFWETKIKDTCHIGYSTLINQLGPVSKLRSDVGTIIENYIQKSE